MTLLMASVILLIVTLGFSLAASLEPSAHRRNVVSLILYYNYYTQWEMFIWTGWTDSTSLFSWEVDLFVILMDFTSPFLDVIRMSILRVPLSLSVPLTFDQNGLKFRVNRHLSSLGSLSSIFQNAFHFCFFFLVTPYICNSYLQPCVDWISIKKRLHDFRLFQCKAAKLKHLKKMLKSSNHEINLDMKKSQFTIVFWSF